MGRIKKKSNSTNMLNMSCLLSPFDCFRDAPGLNWLRIKMRSGAAILI
jgi:hypothetical protein